MLSFLASGEWASVPLRVADLARCCEVPGVASEAAVVMGAPVPSKGGAKGIEGRIDHVGGEGVQVVRGGRAAVPPWRGCLESILPGSPSQGSKGMELTGGQFCTCSGEQSVYPVLFVHTVWR